MDTAAQGEPAVGRLESTRGAIRLCTPAAEGPLPRRGAAGRVDARARPVIWPFNSRLLRSTALIPAIQGTADRWLATWKPGPHHHLHETRAASISGPVSLIWPHCDGADSSERRNAGDFWAADYRRLVGSGTGAVTLSRSVSSPARRTGHAVLPHPAHRRPSPAVFDRSPPGPVRPGSDDDSVEVDQSERVARSVDLGESPGPAAFVPLREEQGEAHLGVLPDLVERMGRVAVPKEPSPAAQENVDIRLIDMKRGSRGRDTIPSLT